MVPCVISQQVSARLYDVGWRHTKAGTEIGEVQQDCHAGPYRDQRIEWVYNGTNTEFIIDLEQAYHSYCQGPSPKRDYRIFFGEEIKAIKPNRNEGFFTVTFANREVTAYWCDKVIVRPPY
jgi:hypothetical protein